MDLKLGSELDAAFPLFTACSCFFFSACLSTLGSVPYSSNKPAKAGALAMVAEVTVRREERTARRDCCSDDAMISLEDASSAEDDDDDDDDDTNRAADPTLEKAEDCWHERANANAREMLLLVMIMVCRGWCCAGIGWFMKVCIASSNFLDCLLPVALLGCRRCFLQNADDKMKMTCSRSSRSSRFTWPRDPDFSHGTYLYGLTHHSSKDEI